MDIDAFLAKVLAHQPIPEQDMMYLLLLAQDVFFKEKNILSLKAPISVCGDIHGQFYDLVHLFEVGGNPKTTKYLFLGDYVDRGFYSLETISILLAYKIKYPDTFFLLRGNHESRQVNTIYGFYDEVLQRYGHPGIWKMCNELFDLFPMAAVIDNKIFCVHGGLSPSITLTEQIQLFDRRTEIPASGPTSDIAWSDPDEILGWDVNPRGAGYLFGVQPTKEFCEINKLQTIARAHQLAMDGYQWSFDGKMLVTVWSAPNYMYRSGNIASIMRVDSNLEIGFTLFDAVSVPHIVIPDERLPPYFA